MVLDNDLREILRSVTGTGLNRADEEIISTAPNVSLHIRQAIIAERTAMAAKFLGIGQKPTSRVKHMYEGVEERHWVVALELDGMSRIGYIYADNSGNDDGHRALVDVEMVTIELPLQYNVTTAARGHDLTRIKS